MNTVNNGPNFAPLAQVANEANTILCFIHPQATYDAVAAATSFCLAAKEAGKSCTVVCEEPMRVEYNYLVGIDKIKQTVGNRDLVVSFAYSEDQVDKVSYNINENTKRFELIVSPKAGAQPLDTSTVNFEQTGLAADVVLLFGFHSLDELGEIYHKEKYALDHAYTVAFTQNKVQQFAKLHLELQPDHFSYSEMVYFLIRQLQLAQINDDLATNLLSGVEYSTERFNQANMPARTFETVANLMRRGAVRQPDNPAYDQLNTPIRQQLNQNQAAPASENVRSVQPADLSTPNDFGSQQTGPSGQINSADLAQAMGGKRQL